MTKKNEFLFGEIAKERVPNIFASKGKHKHKRKLFQKVGNSKNSHGSIAIYISQVRLEAKLETLAEALEEKKKEYSIKEFEVRSYNAIASFSTIRYLNIFFRLVSCSLRTFS